MSKADIILPTFANVVQSYYDRRSSLLKKVGSISEEDFQKEVESLEKTKQHLGTFDIKVLSPLPESKGQPS